jgi:hypothetical protein
MAWWVYKCNRRGQYGPYHGDWERVFTTKTAVPWGNTADIPRLEQLEVGDRLLCYQTDRNVIVGLAKVVGYRRENGGRRWKVQAIKRTGARVRPLKQADRRIAHIKALQGGPIQTIYRISSDEARLLIGAAEAQQNKARNDLRNRVAAYAGQNLARELEKAPGFERNPEIRAAIETHAMRRAEMHYQDRYRVEIRGKPYDLHCTRGARVLAVEVKGTRSSGSQITLTANEVAHARRHQMELFVLHSVRIRRTRAGVHAFGGKKHVIAPWRPKDGQLTPLAYKCRLPGQGATA